MVAPREHTFGGSKPSDSEAVGGSPGNAGFSLSGVFTGGSAASAAAGGVGLGANVATTLLGNPFAGTPSARYSAPVPSTAANSSPVKPGGADAVGQSAKPGPLGYGQVQQSADQIQQRLDEIPDQRTAVVKCGTPERCEQLVWDAAFTGPPGGVVVGKGAQASATVIVRFFNWLFGRGAAKILPNQLPHLLTAETAAAARVGAGPTRATMQALEKIANHGTLKWVATEGGELIVSPHTVKSVEISHAVLSGGKPVLAAGHAEIAAGGGKFVGLSINANSGHFGNGAVDVGKAAFARLGIQF